jgi:ABC-type transport system involved in cytochrome bd biosynthesis fused ATPase/permease subunit
MLALATVELLGTVRGSLNTAIAVSGGAERLEELDTAAPRGRVPWPLDATLRLENVTLLEDGIPIVVDATLLIAPGRRVALTGVSGVGKSTLLRAMGALDRVDVGAITVGGVALDDLDESQLRRELAYVPSEPGLTRGFATDVVVLGRATLRDAVNDLAAMGMGIDRATRFEDLSRGETERVAIARALVTMPSIYLLDEPTSGLGRDETAKVLDLVAATGATVVVATHDAQVVEWCDDVIELHDGSLRLLSR